MIDRFVEQNFFLSNFYPQTIVVDGKKFSTSEHAFQALKTEDPEWFSDVQQAKTPGQAKRLGHQVPIRPDWDSIKLDVMRKCLVAKFSHGYLASKLVATGDDELVEGNNWHDMFWGKCFCPSHNGSGRNELGIMLMQIRKDLKEGKIDVHDRVGEAL